jgi:hypothetical protein
MASEGLTREQRAERAYHLLQDPVFTESLAVLKNTYITGLRQCAAKDDLGRYRYTVALDVIDGITRHIESVLTLGRLHPKQALEFDSTNAIQKIARIF